MPPTKPYKAVAAFVVTFIGTLAATLQGRPELESMKMIDWLIVLGTTLAATAAVYQTTNPPATN